MLSNLPLVIAIAKKYKFSGMEFEELISEGVIGLIKAIHKFDQTYENRLITYAYNWINQHIQRAINTYGKAIRVPESSQESAKKVKKYLVDNNIFDDDNYDTRELAENLNIDESEINILINAVKNPTSLDISEDLNNYEYYDENFESVELKLSLTKLFSEANLTKQERHIIINNFGFNGDEYKLSEIARETGLSRQRIHQSKGEAIKKLSMVMTMGRSKYRI